MPLPSSRAAVTLLLAAVLCLAAPPDFDSLAKQAADARKSSRIEEAVRLYDQALSMNPAWDEGWFYLGTLFYDRDSWQSAADAFSKAADLNLKQGAARVMLGLCEYKLGRYDKALAHIREGRRAGTPADSQFQHVMNFHEGLLLLERGEFDPATAVFFSLVRDGVATDELTTALGLAALRTRPSREPKDAAFDDLFAKVGNAQSMIALKKFEAAQSVYQQLTADHPHARNLWYAYGQCLLAAHLDESAVAAFQAELRNSPDQVLARLRIASLKYRTDPGYALPYAQDAVKLDPQIPLGHYLLGLILLDTGKPKLAAEQLEIARSAQPEEAQILFALGRAYAQSGRPDEAAKARAEFARLQKASK